MKTEKKYYIPQFHLAPPTGWLNDPNGLCQMNEIHHIFFQYSPDDPTGGTKYWGHYETKDFIHYDFTGIFLRPDCEEDRDGVYSGSAYVEDGEIYLFYTGNVKKEGNYDYIYSGREGNTLLVVSRDGRTMLSKECLLKNKDYPSNMSNHVRDPKVIFRNGVYYMALGARTKDDEGCVLIYSSQDKKHWKFSHVIQKDNFGYMWECPDIFELDGTMYLSLSPQGLKSEEYRFQNIYQSGYFRAENCLTETENCLEDFIEWDYGFDFYAPQTYLDEKERRILIGWMGVPDAEYDHDPTIAEGWQHMLTLPRELHVEKDTKRILQMPVKELEDLRDTVLFEGNSEEFSASITLSEQYELFLEKNSNTDAALTFDDGFEIYFDETENVCTFRFLDPLMGYGRTERKIKFLPQETLYNMRILMDTSCMEVFMNDGAYVFTTKLFKQKDKARTLSVQGEIGRIKVYSLSGFEIL